MTWTDERLDDLANRVDKGFEQVGVQMGELRIELKGDVTGLRTELKGDLDGLRTDIKDLRRLMIQSCVGVVVSFLLLLVGAGVTGPFGG